MAWLPGAHDIVVGPEDPAYTPQAFAREFRQAVAMKTPTGAAPQRRGAAPVARRFSIDAALARYEGWLLDHGRDDRDSRQLAVVRSMLRRRSS